MREILYRDPGDENDCGPTCPCHGRAMGIMASFQEVRSVFGYVPSERERPWRRDYAEAE